jgi:xylan 1,4-beta-xylosidase
MPDLELHYTEWSSSYTPSDPMHDSYHQAAYILQKIKQAGKAATSMSYWVFTDIFEEAGPRFTPFHGGFGLLNYQSIKKPAFHSFSFLNKMGEKELSNTDNSSWACRSSDGGIQVLFWDFTITHPGEKINNQEYYIQDLPSEPKGITSVRISGIPEGSYKFEIYKTGYRTNDPYTEYFDMKRPSQLTKRQVEEIKRHNDGSPVSAGIVKINAEGKFEKSFDIRENDVFFLNIVKL